MNKFSITVADASAAVPIDIMDLDIQYSVNEIPVLRLRFLDGNLRADKFELDHEETFSLGKSITVTVLDEKKLLFKGLITGLSLGKEQNTYLEVHAHGDAIKMTEGMTTKLFKSGSGDDVIIKELMNDAKVTLGKVAESKIKHYQYFSYQQSPWRVMMARIMANGFVFSGEVGKSNIIDLQDHQPEEKTLKLTESGVRSFQFDLDTRSQIKKIVSNAWDITKQKLHKDKGVEGKLASYKTIDNPHSVMATKDLLLYSNHSKSPKELEVQATAQNNYRLLDLFQGSITLEPRDNSPLITLKLMEKLKIEGVGSSFSGDYIVTGIRHYTISGQWLMDLDLGLSLRKTLQADFFNLPLLPTMVAKVLKYKVDEEEIERIPLQLSALAKNEVVWARPLSVFASKGEGLFFPPNVDDEVMVGFSDGDCRYPIILGACHNPKQKPPKALKEEKPIRGIFVKQKNDKEPVSIIFDKSTDTLRLVTGKGEINLSEAKGAEFIKEKNNISIREAKILSEKAITISSKEDINVSTDKKLIVKAQVMEVK